LGLTQALLGRFIEYAVLLWLLKIRERSSNVDRTYIALLSVDVIFCFLIITPRLDSAFVVRVYFEKKNTPENITMLT